MFCLVCYTQTKNPKFCSRSCAATFNNKTPKRLKTTHVCKKCLLNVVKRNGATCKPCKVTVDYTLQDAIYNNLHRASAFALVRSRARSTVEHLPKVCFCCGYNKHVEVCHIKPIKDFELQIKISEINSLNNLVLLCPNCHWEFDHNKLILTH